MRFTLADLATAVVMFLILAVATMVIRHSADSVQNRVQCAANLHEIGQALQLYSNENRGAYPRTTFDRNSADKPTWGTPYEGNEKLGALRTSDPFLTPATPAEAKATVPQANDVTAALFLTMRTEEIINKNFICPSSHRKPWDFGGGIETALSWTNWKGNAGIRDHLSYSYENPYPSEAAIGLGWKLNNAISADYAVAADMNPGGDALLKLTPRSAPKEMRDGNSLNHGGDGQNVLFGDGHVVFESSPFVGVQQDNVYTYGGADAKTQGIIGSPAGPDDSILLPTAKDVGFTADMMHPATAKQFNAEEKKAAHEKIVGNYGRGDGKIKVRMTIDENKIVVSEGPMTITFNYSITGQDETGAIVLDLTAPDTKPIAATVMIKEDGTLEFADSDYFDGQWKKQK